MALCGPGQQPGRRRGCATLAAWLQVTCAATCWWPSASTDEVRFGLPPASFPPYLYFDNDTGEWSGFGAAAMAAVATEVGVPFSFVRDDMFGDFSSLYADKFDCSLMDMSAQGAYSEGMEDWFKFTYPWFSANTGAMVRRTQTPDGLWKLFEPFETDLWIAIVVLTFGVAVVLVILMGLSGLTDGKKGLGLTSHGMVKAVYHAWAALLGGEDSEWHDWPGRILRLGLLFIVLVVSATYTANLASFFTRPGIQLHGPKDRASLRDAVACVLPEESTVAIAQPFVKEIISPPYDMEFQAKRQWCHDALQEGQATVWIDDMGSLNEWLLNHCDTTAIVHTIALAPRRYSFVTTFDKRAVAANLSQAIIKLETTTVWKELQRQSFGWGDSCPAAASTATDTTPVSVEQMGGLFIITGTITAVAAVCGCVEAAGKALRRNGEAQAWEATEDVAHGRTEGEMLRALIGKIDRLNAEAGVGSRNGPARSPSMPAPKGDGGTFEDENIHHPGMNAPETGR